MAGTTDKSESDDGDDPNIVEKIHVVAFPFCCWGDTGAALMM